MKTPKTFQISEQNGDPRFPLGIVLASTIPDPDNNTKVNSFSINVLLNSSEGITLHKGKITILEGTDNWIKEEESIIYYKANTLIEDKVIPSVVYHYSKGDANAYYVTLLEF